MGQLDAFSLAGLQLWFNSSDHQPPHFHAKRRGEWEIRVFFLLSGAGDLSYEIKWGSDPSRSDRDAILDEVLAHRAELFEEWEAKVCPR